jgi:hypothetical protein
MKPETMFCDQNEYDEVLWLLYQIKMIVYFIWSMIERIMSEECLQPYHIEYTSSRPIKLFFRIHIMKNIPILIL